MRKNRPFKPRYMPLGAFLLILLFLTAIPAAGYGLNELLEGPFAWNDALLLYMGILVGYIIGKTK